MGIETDVDGPPVGLGDVGGEAQAVGGLQVGVDRLQLGRRLPLQERPGEELVAEHLGEPGEYGAGRVPGRAPERSRLSASLLLRSSLQLPTLSG